MAYATAREAIKDGEIIYGRGNVSAKRTSNGEYIYSRNGATAMDASTVTNRNTVPNSFNEFLKHASEAEIDTFVKSGGYIPGICEAAASAVGLDSEAEEIASAMVKMLMPALELAVANDDAEAEQEAQGSYSSKHSGINENNSQYAREAKQVKQRWQGVRASQNIKRDRYGKPVKQAAATDSIKRNSVFAKPYSMFQSAASIIKRQRKSA